jgi:hypothetical protein
MNIIKKYRCYNCKEFKEIEEFHKDNHKKNKVRNECIKCCKKRSLKYYSTENGFMSKLYSSMKDRQILNNKKNRYIAHTVELTLEEFLKEWKKYIKKYGMKCFYTGVKLDFIKKRKRENQVSVDRIDNNEGYTKNNIIFCSARANFEKHSVTIDMCRKIVALYEKRQGLTKTIK